MTVSVRRFHLEYTKAIDFITWAELECLSKALGIPHTVLTGLCSNMVASDAPGISIELFSEVYSTKDFQEVMNFAYNFHSYEWNSEVIKNSIYIVTRRGLTFDELRTVRAAYAFYEEADTKGMRLVERTLIRCLKMCSRVISAKKMMHRIKHMQDRFEVSGRIQLAEFMELVLWCDLYSAWEARVKQWELAEGKDEKLMWLLNEFYDFLHHQDAKLQHLLDKQYIREEWTFKKEKLNISSRFHGPPVSPELRLRQTRLHHRSYVPIREALRQSEFDVRRGAAGGYYHERRPATAPDFLERRRAAGAARAEVGDASALHRPRSAKELMEEHFGAGATARVVVRAPADSPQSTATRLQRPRTAPIVDKEEKENVAEMIDAIQFDQSTVDVRYNNYMREDLEYLRPGFWRRAEQRSAEKEDASPQPVERRRVYVPQRPSKAFVRKMSAQKSRQPLPSHGKACDARFRGWQVSPDNTRSGPHQAVLVAPSFEKSDVGSMLERLRRTDAEVLNKLHGQEVRLRISRKERRGLTIPATDLVPPAKDETEISKVKAGPADRQTPVRPKTAKQRSLHERLAVTRRPVSSKFTRVTEQERKGKVEDPGVAKEAEIRRLRALLQEGLSVRRGEKILSSAAATEDDKAPVLVAIAEEVS